ncbi:MAG TPA: hypothetical protein VGD29_33845 [Actinoplanes sp.]|jgi:hypothetical protein
MRIVAQARTVLRASGAPTTVQDARLVLFDGATRAIAEQAR